MRSRTAARLVCLYPRHWRKRYGKEFVALLEEHPLSLRTFANVLWSAGEAHMQDAMSHERNQGMIVGSVWSAWILATVAGLILYGLVDDSPLVAVMNHSPLVAVMNHNAIFAGSWKLIEAGCLLAVSAILIGGVPLASSFGLYAMHERRRGIYLRLAVPFVSAFVLIAWIAAVLVLTGGHWAASPWAVGFSRPDWPSESVRWITGSISAVLLLLGCFASAVSISQVLRGSRLPDLRIAFGGVDVRVNPLSFAAALAPWAASGIFVMLTGVVLWGSIAWRLLLFGSSSGPLGLSGMTSWILSTVFFGFAALISVRAAWRTRALGH